MDLVQLPRARRGVAGLAPFGIGRTKPAHYRGMLKVLWENRDNLPYAWKVLTRGTCDGCALGTIGLHDWTLEPDDVHLCMVRLALLRLNTMPIIPDAEARLAKPAELIQLSSEELRNLGRLPYPMRWRAGEPGYVRISWEELFAEAGARIARTTPERFALYLTSRGITNETYYVGQKYARFVGTNNVDNAARLCHSPSTAGLKETIGVGATTVSYADFYKADLIVFLGSNPANDQPVSLKYVYEAKKRGARVVTINTWRERGMDDYWIPSNLDSALFGTPITDDFFLVHTGGDLALLNAVQKLLVERGLIDKTFLEANTTGLTDLRKSLAEQDTERLLRLAGSTFEDLEKLVALIAGSQRMILVWSMGITQHEHGSDTVRAIANLALLRGSIGRPGAGLMPIRGHSGVQGGAEMGAYATVLPGGVPLTPQNAAALAAQYGFPVGSKPGLPTVRMLEAAANGQLDVFHIVGGNFLETLPDPRHVRRALETVPVRIHQDIVLTRQMLLPPREVSYLLPARTRYEQRGGGTETTTERRVILSPEIPRDDVGEALSEWEILMRLGEAVHPERRELLHFADGPAIRAEIARVIPPYAAIADLHDAGDQFQWGGPLLCADGIFPTRDGRGHLVAVKPPELTIGSDELRLSTRRGKQFNSMVQENVDPLTGAQRDHVFMSALDAHRFGLREGDAVTIYNRLGAFHGRAMIQPMRPGNIQAHWPEVNALLPRGRVDPDGGVPDYNAVVRMVRTEEFRQRLNISAMLATGQP